MVKVTEGPMAEAKPALLGNSTTSTVTSVTSSAVTSTTSNNNNNYNYYSGVRKSRNNHHNHHHHAHHIHQTYYTYLHHHCNHLEAGGGGGAITENGGAPAKFYFGPGFEPQNFCANTGGGPVSAPNSEYVVLFHVNPGVTIRFQIGDNLEILRGPVTVPMVSTNSSPPIAMPVQVPPGHVVQQIVDESGTLRHVILSPQHPAAGLVPLTSHNPQHYGAGPPGNSTNQTQQGYYQGLPPGSGFPSSTTAHYGGGPPTHMGHSPPPPLSQHYKDERTQRQYIKLRKKIQDKQKYDTTTTASNPGMAMRTRDQYGVNGLRKDASNGLVKEKDMNSVGTSEDGEESSIPDEEDSVQIIADVLSSVQAPKVSELSSRSALLQWAPPTKLSDPPSPQPLAPAVTSSSPDSTTDSTPPPPPPNDAALSSQSPTPEIDVADLRYEVLLSDKSKEMKFKSIYSGASLSCRIRDLRPGQEYSVCLQVHYDELQGSASDPLKFTTPPCEPDQPQPPKLYQKQRSSLQLKWNSAQDNGAPINSYILEYDEGQGGDFVEFHRSKLRQYTLHKLQPATAYRFRLAACNDIGRSPYSAVVTYTTSPNPPTKPAPPTLLDVAVNSVHLAWAKRPSDDEFTVQMSDAASAANSRLVYHGRETHCVCAHLTQCSEYRFRLRAENDGGQSGWCDEVTYRTLPDRPARPSKPVVKGRIHAHSFKLKWDPPSETGGAPIDSYLLEVNSGSGYRTVYSGAETEALCDRLTPGTTYQLRVSCATAGGSSNYSDPCTVTTDAIAPGQCAQVRVVGKVRATAITVKWFEPDYNGGAPVLDYECELIDTATDVHTPIHKSKETECTALNLRPGTPYGFQVRAVNRIGPGPWSEQLTVCSGAAPPHAPEPLTVRCKSPFHIHVEWPEPECNGATVTEYRVEMAVMRHAEEEFAVVYQGAECAYDVKGLTPFTTYYFRVQAGNAAGLSPYSSVAATITPAAAPSIISTLRSDSTPTTVSLSWQPPPDNGSAITHYNIEFGDRLLATESPVTQYTVDNLQPDTHYKFKVQAVNQIGCGPLSSTLRTATLRLPPAPPRLECLAFGHNHLKLKWGEGRNLDYTQYTVEMENVRYSGVYQCVYKGTALNYKVNKLHESQLYRFRICAANDAGQGDWSEVCGFETSVAPPAAVKMVRVVEVERRECALEWTAAKSNNCFAVVYQVQVCRTKEQTYREVYKGTENHCLINDLEPGTDYTARICPIRLLDNGTELPGPHSSVNFCTTSSLETATLSNSAVVTGGALSTTRTSSFSGASSSNPAGFGHTRNYHQKSLLTRVKTVTDKPAFYAVLITIIGIIISIWIISFL